MEYCIGNQSLLLDLKMIILNVKILFQKDSTEGVSENEQKKVMNGSQAGENASKDL